MKSWTKWMLGIRARIGRSGDRPRQSLDRDRRASVKAPVEFLRAYVPAGKIPMCGNSICQDRRFMARGMPKLEGFPIATLDAIDTQRIVSPFGSLS